MSRAKRTKKAHRISTYIHTNRIKSERPKSSFNSLDNYTGPICPIYFPFFDYYSTTLIQGTQNQLLAEKLENKHLFTKNKLVTLLLWSLGVERLKNFHNCNKTNNLPNR